MFRNHRVPTPEHKGKTLGEVKRMLEKLHDPLTAELMLEAVRQYRLDLRREGLSRTAAVKHWRHLRTALMQELRYAQVSREYVRRKEIAGYRPLDEVDACKRDAYDAYIAVMEKLRDNFDEYIAVYPEKTPLQVLKEYQDRGKLKFVAAPSDHWTDWVPEKVKEQVRLLFQAVPYRKFAKIKVPFERVALKATRRSKRGLLEQAIVKETETMLRQREYYRIMPSQSLAVQAVIAEQIAFIDKRVELMGEAMRRLHVRRDGLQLPGTWHGLFRPSEWLTLGPQNIQPDVKEVSLEQIRKQLVKQ